MKLRRLFGLLASGLLLAAGPALATPFLVIVPPWPELPETNQLATLNGAQARCVAELMAMVEASGLPRDALVTGSIEAYAQGAETVAEFAPGQPKYDPAPRTPGIVPPPPPPRIMGGVIRIRCNADGAAVARGDLK